MKKNIYLLLLFSFFIFTIGCRKKNVRIDPVYGNFSDSRDGQLYETVEFPDLNQTWMAENLNYETEYSMCYDDDPTNCDRFGRLYKWEAAKNACPPGWRLASEEEWLDLLKYYGHGEDAYEVLIEFGTSGFDALLAGWCSGDGVHSFKLGDEGAYWSSSEKDSIRVISFHFYREMCFFSCISTISALPLGKGSFYSCRCIKD